MQALQHQLHPQPQLLRLVDAEALGGHVAQPRHPPESADVLLGGQIVRGVHGLPLREPAHDGLIDGVGLVRFRPLRALCLPRSPGAPLTAARAAIARAHVRRRQVAAEGALDRLADDLAGHQHRALLLALVDQLHLAGHGGQRRVQVGQARVDHRLAQAGGAPLHVAEHVLQQRDRHARRHAGLLVHELALARLERHLLDQLLEVARYPQLAVAVAVRPRLLRRDRHGVLHAVRVVGDDLRVDAVLERRDDVAAVGVVLGIGGEDELDVQRDADGEAADLDVLLLQHVEQRHLDARRQVGQLVDGEDAAVGARDDPVVDDALVGVGEPLGGRLDRVDVADQVGHGDVGGGELLVVALVAVHPVDRQVVAELLHALPGGGQDRLERALVEVAAGDHGRVLVQEAGQRAQDARLGLAAQAEQDEVVPRQDRVDDPGQHGLVVADDAWKQRLVRVQAGEQVGAQLLLDRALPVAGCLELAERRWQRCRRKG